MLISFTSKLCYTQVVLNYISAVYNFLLLMFNTESIFRNQDQHNKAVLLFSHRSNIIKILGESIIESRELSNGRLKQRKEDFR